MRLHLDLNVNGIRLLECQPVALLPCCPCSGPPCWPSTSVWAWRKRAWRADPHVIGFCQSLVLLVGVGSVLLRRLSTDIENCTAASDDSKVVHLQRVPDADSIAPGSMPQRGLRLL